MRKTREIFRLRWICGLTMQEIADSCMISETTVRDYLIRAAINGLTKDNVDGFDDSVLDALLFKTRGRKRKIAESPDFAYMHIELHRKGVTKQLLWEEHLEKNGPGYSYSQYCQLYRDWEKKNRISLKIIHKAGEKMFVDFAGQTMPIYDKESGEIQYAQIFVAVLGASQYSYVKAVWSQTIKDWISAHVGAFNFFGGVTAILTPDNLKSGVSKACLYEPDINPTYLDLATYYDSAVVPARKYKPKDKAKVENAVNLVTRWILAALRHRKFFSLFELNEAISELLTKLNDKPFKKIPGCRRSLYETLDKPALKPLPLNPYQIAEIFDAKAGVDYHIAVQEHYYSVPYQLTGEKVNVRLTENLVEIFFKNRRIVTHQVSNVKYKHTTLPEHRPIAHQKFLDWNPGRFIGWAKSFGEQTATLIEKILTTKPHPEQSYRSCLGVLRLAKQVGRERIEAASKRALFFNTINYKSVKSILDKQLDRIEIESPATNNASIHHENIRGGQYYVQQSIGGNLDVTSTNNGKTNVNEVSGHGQGSGGAAAAT